MFVEISVLKFPRLQKSHVYGELYCRRVISLSFGIRIISSSDDCKHFFNYAKSVCHHHVMAALVNFYFILLQFGTYLVHKFHIVKICRNSSIQP